MMKVYVAGPLFTLAEQRFNLDLADSLKKTNPHLELVLPQLKNQELEKDENFVPAIFDYCIEMVNQCQLMLAILDGADADSGTCIEMGLAYAQGKPIIGVRTDFRNLEDRGLNLMVSHVCTRLIWEQTDDIDELAGRVVAMIAELGLSQAD